MKARSRRFARALNVMLLLGAAVCGTAATAHAQYTFSIDRRGPTITIPDSVTGTCITAGDILAPPPPGGMPAYAPPALPPPGKAIPAGMVPFPGLAIPTGMACLCVPPPAMCPLELDALSYGTDFNPAGVVLPLAGRWVFSVDEFAAGIPGGLAPDVATEAAPGVFEAAADVFEALGIPGGPIPPPPGPGSGNTGLIDGNGFISPSGGRYPGVGLIEPLPPVMGPAAPGDNVDAIDVDTPFGTFPVYFSLDAGFFDPLRGVPNLGSAAVNGFPPAAVLVTPGPGIAPMMYAPPPALGLDLMGPMTDDLDALVLIENGIPMLQLGPGGDVLYYSVRRGSAVIGVPDSLFGIPIEPGDILTLPAFAGGPPSIYIAAEWLGLVTARMFAVPFGDDLDGLDFRGIPATGVPFCIADGFQVACPCGNNGVAPNGCANSVNPAGANLNAAGAASLGAPTVTLTTSGTMATSLCIVVQSSTRTAAVPFGDGMRCFGSPFIRLYTGNAAGGTFTVPPTAGPSIPARAAAAGAPIPPMGMRFYQTYYRNGVAFACPFPATFNATNAFAIQWFP
ncbi:MAG: hypothetical protein ACKVXR_16535 [Planctomycetota bacterium]